MLTAPSATVRASHFLVTRTKCLFTGGGRSVSQLHRALQLHQPSCHRRELPRWLFSRTTFHHLLSPSASVASFATMYEAPMSLLSPFSLDLLIHFFDSLFCFASPLNSVARSEKCYLSSFSILFLAKSKRLYIIQRYIFKHVLIIFMQLPSRVYFFRRARIYVNING